MSEQTLEAEPGADTAANSTESTKAEPVMPAEGAATGAAATSEADIKGDWPDDWSSKLAEGNEKIQKQLALLGSPKGVAKAWIEANKKLTSGNLIEKLPEKPTDEQLANYRKKNGIPEKPDGYDLNELPNGLVIPEHERVFLNKFVEGMHEVNATPAVVKQALAKYADVLNDMAQTAREIDAGNRVEADALLKKEWGGQYKANNNLIQGMLNAQFGADAAKQIPEARLPNGKRMFDDAGVKAVFLRMAMEIDPAATIDIPEGGSAMQSIDGRIKEILKLHQTNPQEYRKHHAEHLQLIAQQQQLKARG